jgi:hypothetical protein
MCELSDDIPRSAAMKKLFAFGCGRHTTFAIFFALAGTVLAFMGKLTGEYVALIGAIQTLVAAHSLKETHYGENKV